MKSVAETQGQAFRSIWDALEDSSLEAANMRMRSELMIAIRETVAGWQAGDATAARRLELTTPRLQDLMRGRINAFSLDSLAALAVRAGLDIRIQISHAAA